MVGVSNSVKVADLISDLNERIKYLERANKALTEYNENTRNDINELNNVAKDYKKKYLKEKEKHEKATKIITKLKDKKRLKKKSEVPTYHLKRRNTDKEIARKINGYLDAIEADLKYYFNSRISDDELVAWILRELYKINMTAERISDDSVKSSITEFTRYMRSSVEDFNNSGIDGKLDNDLSFFIKLIRMHVALLED